MCIYLLFLLQHCCMACRVSQVHPDEKGTVRTVTVELRPRHIQDQGSTYRTKKHSLITIGVQRFATLLPVEEQVNPPIQQDTQSLPKDQETMTSQEQEAQPDQAEAWGPRHL